MNPKVLTPNFILKRHFKAYEFNSQVVKTPQKGAEAVIAIFGKKKFSGAQTTPTLTFYAGFIGVIIFYIPWPERIS